MGRFGPPISAFTVMLAMVLLICDADSGYVFVPGVIVRFEGAKTAAAMTCEKNGGLTVCQKGKEPQVRVRLENQKEHVADFVSGVEKLAPGDPVLVFAIVGRWSHFLWYTAFAKVDDRTAEALPGTAGDCVANADGSFTCTTPREHGFKVGDRITVK